MDDRTRSLRSLVIERSSPAGPSSRPQRWLLPAIGILIVLLVLGSGAALWFGGPLLSAQAPSVERPSSQVVQSDSVLQRTASVPCPQLGVRSCCRGPASWQRYLSCFHKTWSPSTNNHFSLQNSFGRCRTLFVCDLPRSRQHSMGSQ